MRLRGAFLFPLSFTLTLLALLSPQPVVPTVCQTHGDGTMAATPAPM